MSFFPQRALRTHLVWLTLGVAVVPLVGCSADLPEGVYDCSDSGGCPEDWRCFPDNRCYSPDFAGLPLYALCGADGDCMSGECVRAFDDDAPLGQCSESCTSSDDCPDNGVCAEGVGCLAGCETSSECADPDQQSCVVVPRTTGETACIEFTTEDFAGRRACTGTGTGNCPFGAQCLSVTALDPTGICVWPCTPGGECPPGGQCTEMPTTIVPAMMNPRHACLAPCDNTPDACGSPMLSCAPFPDTMRHCAPPGWLD